MTEVSVTGAGMFAQQSGLGALDDSAGRATVVAKERRVVDWMRIAIRWLLTCDRENWW